MPIFVDESQTQCAEISDTSGNTVECIIIPVAIPVADVADIIAAYDANNQYSPPADDARTYARILLDALVRASS
jgi:hypothetical protein